MKKPIPTVRIKENSYIPSAIEEVQCEQRCEIRINEGKVKLATATNEKDKVDYFKKKKRIYEAVVRWLSNQTYEEVDAWLNIAAQEKTD